MKRTVSILKTAAPCRLAVVSETTLCYALDFSEAAPKPGRVLPLSGTTARGMCPKCELGVRPGIDDFDSRGNMVGPKEFAGEAIRVAVFAVSDTGRVRKNNEDAFAVFNLDTGDNGLDSTVLNHVVGPQGTLLLLADGMGGEASGEVASSMCTATVPRRLSDNLYIVPYTSDVNFGLLLREAVEYANQLIFQKGQDEPVSRGMGCTLTVAAIRGPTLFVAQVGDSRAYLCRNGAMVQLTHDQTYRQYLAEMGIETPAGPGGASNRNILLRAVGSRETLEGIEVNCTGLRQGDRVLLCCDGLYNMVRIPEDAAAVVNGSESVAAKCQALVDRANEAGGTDNVTVVLAEVEGPGLPPPDPSADVQTVAY